MGGFAELAVHETSASIYLPLLRCTTRMVTLANGAACVAERAFERAGTAWINRTGATYPGYFAPVTREGTSIVPNRSVWDELRD